MANSFGTDILIQAQDPKKAASFYVKQLAFEEGNVKSWPFYAEDKLSAVVMIFLRLLNPAHSQQQEYLYVVI